MRRRPAPRPGGADGLRAAGGQSCGNNQVHLAAHGTTAPLKLKRICARASGWLELRSAALRAAAPSPGPRVVPTRSAWHGTRRWDDSMAGLVNSRAADCDNPRSLFSSDRELSQLPARVRAGRPSPFTTVGVDVRLILHFDFLCVRSAAALLGRDSVDSCSVPPSRGSAL